MSKFGFSYGFGGSGGEEIPPSLPDDYVSRVTPSAINGLTFSSALPAVTDGYRRLVTENSYMISNPAPLRYAAFVGRIGANEPNRIDMFAAFHKAAAAANWWTDDYQIITINTYGNYFATRGQIKDGEILSTALNPSLPLDQTWHFFEMYNSGYDVSWLVDGASAANRTATEAQFAMNNFSFIPEGGMFERFDLISSMVLTRVPSAGERELIRDWAESFIPS